MARKQAGQHKSKSKTDGSLERWNTYDDIPDDEQDAFHHQQDKIALGDLNGKAAVDDDEYGALGGDREVLGADIESDEGGFGEDDFEEDDDEDDDMEKVEPKEKKGATRKTKAVSSEDEDDDESGDEAEERDEAPTGGWGPNKQSYYSTNDLDDLSSDSEMGEDERREMEVREVKRLQAKSRQGLSDEDFGLGQDTLRLEGSSAAREARRKEFDAEPIAMLEETSNKALDITTIDPLYRAELISKVQKSTPETLALVGEYADIVEDIDIVSKRLKKVTDLESREEVLGLSRLHHQILLTYATNLAFYFYLRASPEYAANPQKLASHGVIGRLYKLKNGLQILDNFGFAADADEESREESESIEEDGDEENVDPETNFLFQPKMFSRNGDDDDEEYSESLGSLEDDELMQLDSEERESELSARSKAVAQANKLKHSQEENGNAKKVKSRSKPKRNSKKAEVGPLANIINAEDEDDSFGALKNLKKKPLRAQVAVTDAEAFHAFGEPTQLTASDSADKEAKRKSLKFYTGQIDAKEARKAGGSGLGGDSDIPYRDRERSRMAVADANARKAASTNGQVDRALNGDDFGEEDLRDWKDVMDIRQSDEKKGKERGDDEDLDYYDLVASGKRSAKRARKEEYDEDKASQRVNPYHNLEEGEHRGISRTIEKNRGLTPRRPKENRNPRVKKRKRFEKAQKKLSSKGPVYKGGQGALQGGYSGETSGINSNVVKSRQFA